MFNSFMNEAVKEAVKAYDCGDVPVGAVIVQNNKVIAAAHNRREADNDAAAHAEILAISTAGAVRGNWRLDDCDLYVTLEPCLMCCGAIREARIRRVYFGAYDKEYGYMVSNGDIRHRAEIYCGIMEDECLKLISEFFQKIRGGLNG
ncbi:MAG TPA: nucleoside deaminase [Firmicutes bacterium]|nr:nucleoside deaminase [Bacillota bacterium]